MLPPVGGQRIIANARYALKWDNRGQMQPDKLSTLQEIRNQRYGQRFNLRRSHCLLRWRQIGAGESMADPI